MSDITRQHFIKLHQRMMETNIDYKKGYEYSKLHPWNTYSTEVLEDMVQAYIDVAIKDKCEEARGHAHAVREIIWAREGGIAA